MVAKFKRYSNPEIEIAISETHGEVINGGWKFEIVSNSIEEDGRLEYFETTFKNHGVWENLTPCKD